MLSSNSQLNKSITLPDNFSAQFMNTEKTLTKQIEQNDNSNAPSLPFNKNTPLNIKQLALLMQYVLCLLGPEGITLVSSGKALYSTIYLYHRAHARSNSSFSSTSRSSSSCSSGDSSLSDDSLSDSPFHLRHQSSSLSAFKSHHHLDENLRDNDISFALFCLACFYHSCSPAGLQYREIPYQYSYCASAACWYFEIQGGFGEKQLIIGEIGKIVAMLGNVFPKPNKANIPARAPFAKRLRRSFTTTSCFTTTKQTVEPTHTKTVR